MSNDPNTLVLLITALLSGLAGFLLRGLWLRLLRKWRERWSRPRYITAAAEVAPGRILVEGRRPLSSPSPR